ncbi:uncharacterized protein B0H18DRAFT_1129814 [Fomitopsis serialis]|uniref:uncharacterized protein n=1 Tax=Fomitopsis serialis TaxID=139415 RepID=UPI002007629A|nr:uncharacterized protein B0H18DRAFT_1129814 [Neoantrodia serialis]KAH9910610.1 hypothetical protein B0H18DRAFT_1129814 [Neoantrodia serialis]
MPRRSRLEALDHFLSHLAAHQLRQLLGPSLYGSRWALHRRASARGHQAPSYLLLTSTSLLVPPRAPDSTLLEAPLSRATVEMTTEPKVEQLPTHPRESDSSNSRLEVPSTARTTHAQRVCKSHEQATLAHARASTEKAVQTAPASNALCICRTSQDASTRAPRPPEDASASSRTSRCERTSREVDGQEYRVRSTLVSTSVPQFPPSSPLHTRCMLPTPYSPRPHSANTSSIDALASKRCPHPHTVIHPLPSPLLAVHPSSSSDLGFLSREERQAHVRALHAWVKAAAERAALAPKH